MTHLFIIVMIMHGDREGRVAPRSLIAAAKYTHDDYVEDREMTKNKNMRIMLKINLVQEMTPLFIIMVWDRAGRMARRV